MAKRLKCIGICIGVSDRADGLTNSNKSKLANHIGEKVYETNKVSTETDGKEVRLIVFESNRQSYWHPDFIKLDERIGIELSRAILENKRDELEAEACKYFLSELKKLCIKWKVDVSQMAAFRITDKLTGYQYTEGKVYDEIRDLFDWLEYEMNFSYQSVVCNDEECLAH